MRFFRWFRARRPRLNQGSIPVVSEVTLESGETKPLERLAVGDRIKVGSDLECHQVAASAAMLTHKTVFGDVGWSADGSGGVMVIASMRDADFY